MTDFERVIIRSATHGYIIEIEGENDETLVFTKWHQVVKYIKGLGIKEPQEEIL